MIGPALDYLDAAYAALVAGLPSTVHVHDGPLSTDDNIGGADIVVVGHDSYGDDEGTAIDAEGGWHNASAIAPTSHECTVWVSVMSMSGPPVSMAARRAAAKTLLTSVQGVLFASAPGSALGVSGVQVAHPARIRYAQHPTQAGNQATYSLGIRLILEPTYT